MLSSDRSQIFLCIADDFIHLQICQYSEYFSIITATTLLKPCAFIKCFGAY